jgi:hypothetical protein
MTEDVTYDQVVDTSGWSSNRYDGESVAPTYFSNVPQSPIDDSSGWSANYFDGQGETPEISSINPKLWDLRGAYADATETAGGFKAQQELQREEKSATWADSLKQILGKDSKVLEALIAGGAGLLKSVGQQESQREQMEFMDKLKKEEWQRKMDARKPGAMPQVMRGEGLLATQLRKQQGVK